MRIGHDFYGLAIALCATLFVVLGVCSGQCAVFNFDSRSKNMREFDGIWRSRGYGWVVSIRGSKYTLHHVANGTCVIETRQDVFVPGEIFPGFVAGSNGSVIRASVDDSDYLHTFDKLAALPDVCQRETSRDAVTVFNAVVDYFDAHYPFFERRNIDWAALVSKHRQLIDKTSSDKALYKVLEAMLSEIGDGHIALEGKVDGKKRSFVSPNLWVADGGSALVPDVLKRAIRGVLSAGSIGRWTSGIGARLIVGDYTKRAKGKISYGLIGGDVGYLAITSLEDIKRKKVAKVMRDVVAKFADARAIIVDVSSNEGGLDSIARQIASYFANERTLGFYKYAGDDASEAPQGLHIEPAEVTIDASIPVFVLTGRETYSAAEVFVLAMRALPNITHVGSQTAGILSDTLWKRLPNGWNLSLSNEVYLDHDRQMWEAVGIAPEIAFNVDEDDDVGRDDVAAARSVVRYLLANSRS